jgi:alpha-ketoglutarate-dependent taurine dioxygenase
MTPGGRLPLLARPARSAVRLDAWLGDNRCKVGPLLSRHGAILFRGFGLAGAQDFEPVVASLSGEALDYVYRSTPRTAVGNRIFTATEYPPRQNIPLHNENAYQLDWPMRLLFYCVRPAEQGGETIIADMLKVTARIDPRVREGFLGRGVMYVRNYGGGVDLPWQTVFQTGDRAEVEQYCRDHQIDFEWKADDCLRTSQTCQAMARHPETGDQVWFNQAHLFHVSGLEPGPRRAMLSVFGEENLPRNAYYGDGSPIDEDALEDIRRAFDAETIRFPWEAGDLLLVDNMLVAHGRSSYRGARQVLVAMTDSYSNSCGVWARPPAAALAAV